MAISNNSVRTVLNLVGGILIPLSTFLGCHQAVLPATGFDCSASWVPPQYAPLLTIALVGLNLVIKAFGQGGTVVENLTKPSVAVTPEAKVGTVTPEQVKKAA